MSFFEKLFGSFSDKELKRINPLKDKVLALEPEMAKLTDDELKAKTTEFKERLAKGETLDDLLPEAFAVCREADWRVLGMKPYPVQIIGGIVLHRACIAEMQTGEGKTLVATMPTYLNALTGEGVHVVTVNDYLARRDSEWMGKVYRFLGLTVGLVVHGVEAGDRKKAYEADVTYGTNNEFGFDYLRDNMVVYKANMVQRGHAFAIVDEVDSILIDEARTPLIISGKGEDSSVMYKRADDFAKTLKKSVIVELDDKVEAEEQVDGDYVVDEKRKTATLTESGVKKAEAFFHVENLADADNMSLRHYIDGAIKARGVMHRDTDYIVKDGEVIIVDEFTGRLMYGRRFNDGLHQAIEAKEGVTVAAESKTLATVTFQNYFRMYKKLSGMTGTASTEADEFSEIYGLNIVSIPTNKPRARKDLPDSVYKTVNGKYNAVIEQVAECHAKGQPVLVGTVSVEKSEALSKLLKKKGIEHNVLNAKQHEREAEIVAQAGKQGAVTIATNMAGRGTDIMLGGNVTYMAKAALKKELSKELTANLAELKDAYEHEKARAKASGTELPTPPEAGIDAKLEMLMTECDGHAETEDAEILHARRRFEELCEEFTPEVKREAEVVRNAGGLFIIVTVAVMPEAEEVELEINPKDLRIDTFRSSGAGGQHINKTSSAIRVTHLPTGMVVECQDQRSQRENKDRALKVLRSRLLQQKQDAYDEEYNARRQSQVGSGDRSEKIRTYNFPQDRVTDHRIGLTLRNLQGVLDGDLDRVVEPLILADREEKLKQSSTEEGK